VSAKAAVERRPAGRAPSEPEPGPGLATRRAALLLHALSESDRAWLLERLAEAERSALGALLHELEALGIPADGALVAEVVGGLPGQGQVPSTPADGPEARGAELARARPEALVAVLCDEPPGLVARVLHLREWPWKAEVLRRLGPAKAERVRALLVSLERSAAPGAGAALSERLVARLGERLGGSDRGTAANGAPGRGWLGLGAARLLGRGARR